MGTLTKDTTTESGLLKRLFSANLRTTLFSELAFAAGTVIDGIITSRFVGEQGIAAIGISAPFFSLLAVFSGMIGIGCQTGCSREIGLGKRTEANRIYSTILTFSILVSALLTMFFLLFSHPVVRSWGASGASSELEPFAADYLRGCAIGIAGAVIYYVFSPILTLEGKRRTIRMATTVLIVSNIAGDLINVYLFSGSVFGMGAATSASHLLALAVMIAGCEREPRYFAYDPQVFDLKKIPKLMLYGISKAVRRLCNAIRPVFLNRLVTIAAGSAGITALAVQGNLRALMTVLSAGIGGAILVMSGVLAAEEDASGLRQTFIHALRVDLFQAVPLAVAFAVFSPVLVSFYISNDPAIEELAVFALRCYSLALPFVVFNEMCINYFQGTGKTFASSVVSMLSRLGTIVPCALVGYAAAGIRGIFAALFTSELLLSVLLVLFALWKGSGRTLTERMLFLPEDFGSGIAHSESYFIQDPADSFDIPYEIYAKCREWGIDERQSNLASLFSEEILLLAKENTKKKDPHIDIRVIRKTDGTLALRVRDDCELFDPERWMDEHLTSPEDISRALGLRILLFLSSDYEYRQTFKLNNVYLTVDQDVFRTEGDTYGQ